MADEIEFQIWNRSTRSCNRRILRILDATAHSRSSILGYLPPPISGSPRGAQSYFRSTPCARVRAYSAYYAPLSARACACELIDFASVRPARRCPARSGHAMRPRYRPLRTHMSAEHGCLTAVLQGMKDRRFFSVRPSRDRRLSR